MNFLKNRNFQIFVVFVVVLGLVLTYVPLIFSPHNEIPPQTTGAALAPQIEAEPSVPSSAASQTSTKESSLPESFQGLEEESESLNGLLEGLGE